MGEASDLPEYPFLASASKYASHTWFFPWVNCTFNPPRRWVMLLYFNLSSSEGCAVGVSLWLHQNITLRPIFKFILTVSVYVLVYGYYLSTYLELSILSVITSLSSSVIL
jgi:hypothetical protein